jgi:toxin ParE1/3/4
MSSYRLSRPARADLDSIWLHIAQEGDVETADRFIDAITNRFSMLAKMPEAGRSAAEIDAGVRVFPLESYLIYYRIHRGGISIARIIHGMRDQNTAWNEEAES